MVRRTPVSFIAASLMTVSSSQISTLAFTPTSPPPPRSVVSHRRPSRLSYQEGSQICTSNHQAEDTTLAPHIDDSNHELVLNNPLSLPVLVDCYTDKCGPCKLIERSLQQILPKYTSGTNAVRLSFAKWDTETKDYSGKFMSLLREYDMTFRKLPTLLLFVDGIPVAMKSGMMSAAAIERFLEENLGGRKGERRPRVGPDGALGVSTRKMNR